MMGGCETLTEERKKEKLFAVNEELFIGISEEEFDRLTFESNTPSLVMFGAERCKVCKELHPMLEELLPNYAGKINNYFIDIDANKDMMKRFRLRGIPMLLIFSGGEVKERLAGLPSEEELIDALKRILV